MARIKLFNMRLTEDEYSSWGDAAKRKGLGFSEYVRMCVTDDLEPRTPVAPPKELLGTPRARKCTHVPISHWCTLCGRKNFAD